MNHESVLCIKRSDLEDILDLSLERIPFPESKIKDFLNSFKTKFLPRPSAEKDPSYKQIIPYCIVTEKNRMILTYKRKGSEKRLHGLESAGIGGHINEVDISGDTYSTIYAGLQRELKEELPNILSYTAKCLGFINEDKTPVGKVHLGIVFLIEATFDQNIPFSEEISDFQWKDLKNIELDNFELWSKLALGLLLEQ